MRLSNPHHRHGSSGARPRRWARLSLLLALGALAACGGTEGALGDRPNIIILVSDDQDYEHFGFAGHPLAPTPTIDRLAEEGVVFTHGFVPMSRCRPSQASLLSGQWPHQSGVYFNVGADHIDPHTSIARHLKDAGYATIGEGKFWEYAPRPMGFSNYTIRNYETFVREGQDHLFRFIDEHAGKQPMFIWWAPELPHVPHNPEPRHLARVDRDAISIPDYYDGDPDAFREKEHLSLAMEAWLDEGVDELIRKLKDVGAYENTLFCLWIDNGYANGLVSKGSGYDKGLRTPFVLHWPGGLSKDAGGTRYPDLVSTVDLYATLLDYGGARIPRTCEGTSFRPRIEGKPYEAREALYGALYLQSPAEPDADAARDAYALWARTERWKYVWFLRDVKESDDASFKIQANLCAYPERRRGDEDLFDLDRDPYELTNLAALPANAAVKEALREAVLDWWRETGGDPLNLP